MALLDFEYKDGIQQGRVGDECIHCKKNRNIDEVYDPYTLDRQTVYKLRIRNIDYCLCMDCFMKTLGDNVLLAPGLLEEDMPILEEEEKPQAKKSSKKKEGDEANANSEAAKSSKGSDK
jgi:hypothetical protein